MNDLKGILDKRFGQDAPAQAREELTGLVLQLQSAKDGYELLSVVDEFFNKDRAMQELITLKLLHMATQHATQLDNSDGMYI